jgi:hypothetical protein
MSVEAGAGRFHTGQKHIIQLIKELGLSDLSIPIGNKGAEYYNIHDTGVVGVVRVNHENPNNEIILKLVELSKREPIEKLRNISLLDYCDQVLHDKETKVLKESFGYYSELVIMNAHDALELIKGHLSSDHDYLILRGGLIQIIERLEKKVIEMGGVIKKNHMVVDIQETEADEYIIHVLGKSIGGGKRNKTKKHIVSCSGNNFLGGSKYNNNNNKRETLGGGKSKKELKYNSKNIICALPKQVLQKMSYFKEIKNDLRKIVCESLCRLYSKFPPGVDDKIWFDGMSKFNTNNNLRMVIPIDSKSGVIMSSYTDYKYARFWKRLYDKSGEGGVNKELVRLLKQSTGLEDIPMPLVTHIFFWECGVGYWGVGVNSHEVAAKMICPFGNNVFICGEHFSEKNQQWIEGALETSQKVISRIFL